MQTNNISFVLSCLLKQLKISVTRGTINEELKKHPYKSSILAISDLLNIWNVPNSAYNLDVDELVKLPTPFIAYLKSGNFIVIKESANHGFIIDSEQKRNFFLSFQDFADHFGGTVLIAEKDVKSGELNYLEKKRKELFEICSLYIFIIVSIILYINHLSSYSSFWIHCTTPIMILLGLKIIGIIISIFLLMNSVNANSDFFRKVCKTSGSKCNEVLSSPSSKLTSWLSWSDLGFFYFTGSLSALFFGASNRAVIELLAVLNLFCLPYSVYSIFYQWKVLNQWCIFCCSIQLIFWLEYFVNFFLIKNLGHISHYNEWFNIVIVFLIPVVTWFGIKPFILKLSSIENYKDELSKFKYDINIFNSFNNNKQKISLLDNDSSIILGNIDANITITIVSNLYCAPCSKMHAQIDYFLSNRPDINFQIIFAVPYEPDSIKLQAAIHLLKLYRTKNPTEMVIILSSWYSQEIKDYNKWSAKYPVSDDCISCLDMINAQLMWLNNAKITGTPTLFLNGQKLPFEYQLDDLKYLI